MSEEWLKELETQVAYRATMRTHWEDIAALIAEVRRLRAAHEEARWCLEQAQRRVHAEFCFPDEDPATCPRCARWAAAIRQRQP